MCLRIWSTGPDMRVSTARHSDDSRSAPEFSCTFWTGCRSIRWPRHSWKKASGKPAMAGQSVSLQLSLLTGLHLVNNVSARVRTMHYHNECNANNCTDTHTERTQTIVCLTIRRTQQSRSANTLDIHSNRKSFGASDEHRGRKRRRHEMSDRF